MCNQCSGNQIFVHYSITHRGQIKVVITDVCGAACAKLPTKLHSAVRELGQGPLKYAWAPCQIMSGAESTLYGLKCRIQCRNNAFLVYSCD